MVFYLPLLEKLRKKNREPENQEQLQIRIDNSFREPKEMDEEKDNSIVVIEIL